MIRIGGVAICAVLFLSAQTGEAQEHLRMKIGESEYVQIESPRPYPAGAGNGQVVWSQVISQAGATFVRVHFTAETMLNVEAGDTLLVRDAQGHVINSYTGVGASNRWSTSSIGESVTVELISNAAGGGGLVEIDQILWGFEPLFPEEPVDQGGVAGASYKNICLATDQTRIRKSDPVTRLSWVGDCGGGFVCTGWLFSPYGHMMTNAHCANSASEANSLEAWFNYQPVACQLPGHNTESFDLVSFHSTVCNLDVAVHLVNDSFFGNPADDYGYLKIKSTVPPNGTQVWLPQHPGGTMKKIDEGCSVIDSQTSSSNFCQDPPTCSQQGGGGQTSLQTSCDVSGGSSGSPILDTTDQVIAIANAEPQGGGSSFGVRMFNVKSSLPDPPISLDVTGPAQINETQTAQLVVITEFLLAGVKPITNFASFTVNPPSAGTVQAGGVFVPADVPSNTVVTITAAFGNDGFTLFDNVTILVVDQGPQGPVFAVSATSASDTSQLCPGDTFDVEINISATKPVADLRQLQFDVSQSQNVTVNSVTWDLQSLSSPALYFFATTQPVFSAVYTALSSVPGFIISVNSTPQIVAHLNVTYEGGGSGVVDVCGIVEPPTTDESVRFQAGFIDLLDFTQAFGNVQCVPLSIVGAETGCESVAIVSSDPPDGAIDARQPFNPDGSNVAGWQSIILEFTGDPSSLTPADFSVTELGGDGFEPVVTGVVPLGGNELAVFFDGVIEFGAWTILTHDASGTSTQIGFLPGDVSGDGTSAVPDVLALIDSLNGVNPLPLHSTDIDRSGVASAPDVLREIDLLNGAGAYPVFNGMSLP